MKVMGLIVLPAPWVLTNLISADTSVRFGSVMYWCLTFCYMHISDDRIKIMCFFNKQNSICPLI